MHAQLIRTNTDGDTKYEFKKLALPLKFNYKIYSGNLTLKETENDQEELIILINKLNNDYSPRKLVKIEEKTNVIKSVKKNYFMRNKIINAFEKVFLFTQMNIK